MTADIQALAVLLSIFTIGLLLGGVCAGFYYGKVIGEMAAIANSNARFYMDGVNKLYREALIEVSEIRDRADNEEARQKCAEAILKFRDVRAGIMDD